MFQYKMVELIRSLIIERNLTDLLNNSINKIIPMSILKEKINLAIDPRDSNLGYSTPNPYFIINTIVEFIENDGPTVFINPTIENIPANFNYNTIHPLTGKTIFHYNPNLLYDLFVIQRLSPVEFTELKVKGDFYGDIPYNLAVDKKMRNLLS